MTGIWYFKEAFSNKSKQKGRSEYTVLFSIRHSIFWHNNYDGYDIYTEMEWAYVLDLLLTNSHAVLTYHSLAKLYPTQGNGRTSSNFTTAITVQL